MDILLATNNNGKAKEMKEILSDIGINVFSLRDKNIVADVVEDGTTFEENSMKKAKEIQKLSGMITVADDSGLEVDYLSGAPGVYSARYAGENATDREKYTKLLSELNGVPENKRKAKFVSVISIAFPDGQSKSVRGECLGTITKEPIGTKGFGYDPVFFCTEINKTFGLASDEEKNSVSHRGKALHELKEYLKQMLQ